MAIIINPQQPSAGYMFGSGLGQTLGQGLQELAQSKLSQLQARQSESRIAKNLEGLGLSSQDAQVFAQLPESQRAPAALDYLQQLGQQAQVAPEAVQQPGLQQLQQQPMASTEQVQGVKDLLGELGRGNQLPQMQQQNVSNRLNAESFDSLLKNALARGQLQQQQPAPLAPPPGTAPVRQLPKPPVEQPVQEAKKPLTAQQFLASRPELLAQPTTLGSAQLPGETPVQYAKRLRDERKELADKEKESRKEQHAINKETQLYVNEIDKRAHASIQAEKRLSRMEKLINEGSLPVAAFYNQIKDMQESKAFSSIPVVGSVLDSLVHVAGRGLESIQKGVTARDTEEFEKLSQDFLKEAKDIFGSRITDVDLKAFLKTVPTVSMTDSGKKQVIRNIKLFNEANLAEKKAMDQIIAENGGKRPADLKQQAEKRAKPELDRLAEAFINGTTNSILNSILGQ